MKNKRIILVVLCLLPILPISASLASAQVADPTIAVAGGPSTSLQTALVTVSDSTSGAVIYYTTDGSPPTSSSAVVMNGSTLLVSQNSTLKVQAHLGTTFSNVISSTYSNAGMVSAGARHTLILKNDGTVWAVGDNTYGELGNDDVSGTAQSNPVEVKIGASAPLTGIVSIAAGTDESFAVDKTGNVWAWGYNPNGQLGIGDTYGQPYATQVTNVTDAIAIASNQYHTIALLANGSVWAWGANTNGQVGNGAAATWVTLPTQVVAPSGQTGYLGGIVAVAAGANHSLALDNTGKVWAWGANASGQLGNNDSTLASQYAPVSVLKNGVALVNVIGIAANATNSFALRNDGSVFAWGDNSTGELGTGNLTSSLSAVQVSGLSTMTAVGNEVALDPNGNVWTWGSNTNGQLGIGYTGYYATLPLEVNPLSTSSPTLTVTTGNGQTVTDGTFSAPFTITAKNGTTPVSGAWVNLVIAPTNGFLGTTSNATQVSPIIGGITGSNGQISFYLDGASTGTVTLTTTSGSSSTLLSAVETAAQIVGTDTPTMPQWGLLVMVALLAWAATRQKSWRTR